MFIYSDLPEGRLNCVPHNFARILFQTKREIDCKFSLKGEHADGKVFNAFDTGEQNQ